MIKLSNVTLVIIDTKNIDLALQAIKNSTKNISFYKVIFFTKKNNIKEKYLDIDIIDIEINNIREYNDFILTKLVDYIETEFLQIIQWDGFIINHLSWTNEYYNYDYIGAPWYRQNIYDGVGNGGFSFRSKKLMSYIKKIYIENDYPEDYYICKKLRNILIKNNFNIAGFDISTKYSFEIKHSNNTFGFHGLRNFIYIYEYNDIVKTLNLLNPNNILSGELYLLISSLGYNNITQLFKYVLIHKILLIDKKHFLNPNARGLVKILINLNLKEYAFKIIIYRIIYSPLSNIFGNLRLILRLIYG